ncbi:MAG: hypothetical protein FJ149_12000 [Euryarchaeota archaeon]|nr:hypothetical protein [Euryarchaeota archaeon]
MPRLHPRPQTPFQILRALLPPRQLRQSDDDPQSPFYVRIVQRGRGNELDRMAVCAICSMLKSDLADRELLRVVPALDGTLNRGESPVRPFFIRGK